MVPFSTRHTPSCHFSHIDPAGLPFLGYFPQDIIGFPIFDFYHQDDLASIREVYDMILMQEGSFFSKPYRFKIFNGDYIVLETEWTCFINPWSKKFEFIVGQHRIVQGPSNINVFAETDKTNMRTNDQKVMKKAEEEVTILLSQRVKRAVMQQKEQRMQDKSSKRKRSLAARVTELIEAGAPVADSDKDRKTAESKKAARNENESSDEGTIWSDKESVLIGGISPHRENSEDLQDQRLQDNIERFFASQPKTICPSSSNGSSSQNQSPDGSGSNDGSGTSSSKNNKSSNDSAFQSGSCGDGVTQEMKNMDDTSHDVTQVPTTSDPHVDRIFLGTLTEEILAQHDRSCQRQLRKAAAAAVAAAGQSHICSKSLPTAGEEAPGLKQKKLTTTKDKAKRKKRTESSKNGMRKLDEMFKHPSFAVQPPFALGFTPFILGPNGAVPSCQSCSSGNHDVSQSQTQSHQTQQFFLPVMCSLPIPLCTSAIGMNTGSGGSGGSAGNNAPAVQFSNQINGRMTASEQKSVRVQTETMSPVRHMSPLEQTDYYKSMGGGKGRSGAIMNDKDSSPDVSYESTSFGSSSGSEESSGRCMDETGGVTFPHDQSLDRVLETMVKSEVPPPWILAIDECTEDIIYRYKMTTDDIPPDLPDLVRQQPALVKAQFNLLRQAKENSVPSSVEVADGCSDPVFKVSNTSVESGVVLISACCFRKQIHAN